MVKRAKKERKEKKSKKDKKVKVIGKEKIVIHINSHNKKKVTSRSQPKQSSQTVFVSTNHVPYLPNDSGSQHLYPMIEHLYDKIDKLQKEPVTSTSVAPVPINLDSSFSSPKQAPIKPKRPPTKPRVKISLPKPFQTPYAKGLIEINSDSDSNPPVRAISSPNDSDSEVGRPINDLQFLRTNQSTLKKLRSYLRSPFTTDAFPEDEPIPEKRGRGRPVGSKNKPKTTFTNPKIHPTTNI